MGVGLFGIGTFTQVNGITSAVGNFFDPNAQNVIHLLGRDYTLAVVILRIDPDCLCWSGCYRRIETYCKSI